MNNISDSVIKVDHESKINGSAVYACDYPADDMLHGRILRSSVPKGIVLSVTLPGLPEGYFYADKNNVPGVNAVHIVDDDMPVFTDRVEYIGDAIGILTGPDPDVLDSLFNKITVEYEELEPVFDVLKSDVTFYEFDINKGDFEAAARDADFIFEETYETGLQEHMYLETNGIIGRYKDGCMYINGSIQCPYYIHTAVAQVLGLPAGKVIIRQDVTGGGFGGKEDYPSVLASQVAVAACLSGGKPVRVIFDRKEDITATPKRHPSVCRYKAAVKDGRITGLSADVLLDAGAYTTLSKVVLQRSAIAAAGVYNIPNLTVHAHAKKTNTVPNGAFRGFGGPQTFFAIEMFTSHIASQLNLDPLDFKLKQFVAQGDKTSTSGLYHFPVPLPEMTKRITAESRYFEKRKEYKNQRGRYRKGIGFSAVFHGAGFTGSGERDKIKAVAELLKHRDDTVEILTSCTDMGQGLFTVFTKIVASVLDIPAGRIVISLPDTSKVPDSGPTVASRSVMVVGELLRRAALKMKDKWQDGKELTITEKYEHPDFMIDFDDDTFSGDAYPTYSWAVTVVETQIDTLTGLIDITGAWACYDIGTIMDINIVTGQMEGGLAQSLGYAMMEQISTRDGKLNNTRFSDYIIPTALDFPVLNVMFHVEEYPNGPFGAKGAGELPHVGGAPAVLSAIENAAGNGKRLCRIPFLPEDIIALFQKSECGES